MTAYHKLLNSKLSLACNSLGYSSLTPVQQQTLTHVLTTNGEEKNSSLVALSPTGTGKTLAFLLPFFHQFLKDPSTKVVILAPTRELVDQTFLQAQSIAKLLPKKAKILSSRGEDQTFSQKQSSLEYNLLITTPSRAVDLIEKKLVSKQHFSIILDEMDLLLEESGKSYLQVIRKFFKVQTYFFFSATFTSELKVQLELFTSHYHLIDLRETKDLSLLDMQVYFVQKEHKYQLLLEILSKQNLPLSLLFVNSRLEADNLKRFLHNNELKSQVLHGGKTDTHRKKAMRQILEKDTKFLISTQLAARGIDIPELTHVINFDFPNSLSQYEHRIGRVARAGKSGVVINFCSSRERDFLRKLESKYHFTEQISTFHSQYAKEATGDDAKPRKQDKSLRKHHDQKRREVDKKKEKEERAGKSNGVNSRLQEMLKKNRTFK